LAPAAEAAEPASLACVSGNGATNVFAAVLPSLIIKLIQPREIQYFFCYGKSYWST
jgi:hypothetical protein